MDGLAAINRPPQKIGNEWIHEGTVVSEEDAFAMLGKEAPKKEVNTTTNKNKPPNEGLAGMFKEAENRQKRFGSGNLMKMMGL